MKRFVLVLVLLALLVSPVAADLINTTVIANSAISNAIGTEFSGLSFLYTTIAPTVVQELKVSSYGNGIPTNIVLTRNDLSTISMSITTTPISLIQRQQVVSIAGGTTSTETVLWFLYPVNRIFFAQTNDTPKTYYLIITDLTNFIDLHGVAFDLDTTRDAYITLGAKPSSNPVRSVSITSNGGTFSGTLYYVNVESIAASETNPENRGETSSHDLLWLLGQIGLVIGGIAAFIAGAASYVMTMGGLVIFVMSAQIFLTLVAAYTAIALILSFYDSDDLFYSIDKFWRYEMKLWRFFMEIFKWMKETIKWW